MQRVALVLAAAAVTGFGIAATNAAVGNSPTTAPSAIPAPSHPLASAIGKAFTPSPESQIDGQLAKLTGYALSPGHMDHFVSLLDHSTRHRLATSSTYNQNFGKSLDAQIRQVDTIWKTKYGHAFSARTAAHDFAATFASFQIGAANKDAKLASEVMSSGPLRLTGDESVALADVKTEAGLPAIRVPLACKSGGWWRIVAPGSLTADKLRANLQSQLSGMTAPNAHWPASESDAYRQAAHRVLMAVLDQPAVK